MAVRTFARSLAPVFTLVLLVGCGSLPNVPLPAKPAAGPPVANQPRPDSAAHTVRGQILAAYQGYWQAYGAALRTRNIAAARKLLRGYADAAFVSQVTAPLTRLWAAHEIGYGFAVTHVLSFAHKANANTALLHDCLDLSRLGTQDAKTGRIVPGSFGLPTVNFYVTLSRSGPAGSGESGTSEHWLVSRMLQVEVPCTP
jgi:hypothetical protein